MKKETIKAQSALDEAEEEISRLNQENTDLGYKISDAEAIAREDRLMHQMMMKEQEEKFTQIQHTQIIETEKQDVLVDKIQE